MSIKLRPDQEQVAAYDRGYMAVPAVPGAGKTTVLAYLAADLIARGATGAGRILIVTYTNSAVGNFRGRIGQYLEERGMPRQAGYEVRTIHSLAMNIVRERPEAIGWSENFRIADELRISSLVGRLTNRWVGKNRDLWESMLLPDLRGMTRNRAEDQWLQRTEQLMRGLIGGFKSRRLTPETALQLTRHLPETSVLRWAAEIYVPYQQELSTDGTVDFGDLMLGAHQLLSQESETLARLQTRWTYIFEDEAQDSYRLQEQLLKLLAGPEGNLVRVGDANQAIMGTFTSAEPDLFRRFCRDSQVAYRPLTMAGRSSPDIIDLANQLVRWVRTAYPEREGMESLEDQVIEPVPDHFFPVNPRPQGYTIVTKVYDSQEQELIEIARLAARSVQRSPEKTIGVLVPINAMAVSVTDMLLEYGVNARQLGGPTSPERQQTVLNLLAVLEYLAVPHEPERLLKAIAQLMHLPNVQDAPFAAFIRECRPEELFYPLDGSAPFVGLYQASPECNGDIALHDALDNLARWLPQSIISADELVVILAGDMGLSGEELSIAHHLAVRVRKLLQDHPAFALTDAVQHLHEELQAMGKFADTLYDRKGFQPLPGVVYVTTCHSAKGLEWDTVYVCSLTRADFPGQSGDSIRSEHWYLPEEMLNPEALAQAELTAILGEDPEGDPVKRARWEIIGERLRLFYVAITRAKENLFLSCHKRNRWGKDVQPSIAFAHLRAFSDAQRSGRA